MKQHPTITERWLKPCLHRILPLVASCCTALSLQIQAAPILRITEVMSNGDTADWFEVTNYGDTSATITGYQVDDGSFAVGVSLPLNGVTSIAPGESVVFLEGNATTVTTFKTNWALDGSKQVGFYSGSGIGLASAGDGVTLFNNSAANSGTELAGPFGGLIRLSFPAATTGTSFNWSYDVNGNSTSPAAGQLTTTTSTWSNGGVPMIGTPGVPTPSAPASSVSIAAASINEGNSGTVTLNLPVSRTDSFNAFTVDYAVTAGTATSGTDYAALSAGTLTFTAGGANSQNIAITINGDTVIESNETITVTLSNLVVTTGQATLATASASGTITNDDAVPLAFPPTNAFTSTVKGTITLAGSEIPAFDPLSKRAFASSNVGVQVVDLTNPAAPTLITTIAPTSLGVAGLTSDDVSSVAVRKGTGGNPSVLAAAIITAKPTNGYVIFLNAADGSLLGSIEVGSNPDHINFTPDGTKLLVANEGELNGASADVAADTTLGTVSIINLAAGFGSLSATTADFTAFDSQVAALRAAGVRIFKNASGTDAVPSKDFEPEYFAVSADSTKAMVTLQEANAVAVLDIATSTFTSVKPLGKKDFSTLRADFSDRDGAGGSTLVNPTTGSPVFGLYMPDAIASYSSGGQTYYVTANEGDDRNDFLTPDETTTVGNAGYDLDNTIFPNETTLKNNAVLGRLNVVNTLGNRGDTDGDGDIDEIQMLGARSFSILDAAGNRVFDSGDMIEMIVASQHLANFDDTRSDNKGPEPEGVTVASFGGRSYAFIGLERSGMVLAFDVTNPAAVTYTTSFKRSGDLNPEGLVVVSAADSPSGKPLLLSANEVSNTLTIFEIDGAPAADYTLQILHYYGESGLLGIQTAPIMGAMIDKFDNDYANTIVVGEGDSFIPGPWLVAGADPTFNRLLHTGTFSSAADTTATPFAQADVAIMNLFGTAVSALGNHEFDLGSPVLSGSMFPSTSATLGNWAGAQFPLITANLDFAADSSLKSRADSTLGGTGGAIAGSEVTALKAKIAPYAIKTVNGQKIGFVGATTWELLSKSSPNGTVPKDDANSATSDLQEVAAYLQTAINALQALGVNKIVMVDQLDTLQRNKDLAGLVSGIDVMVAGGGHERMGDATDTAVAFNGHDANFISDAYPILTTGADSKPVLIVTSDTEYSYLGRLVVDFDANGELITSNLSTALNGAYAASEATLQAVYNTSNSASTIIAASTIGSGVKTITDQISSIVTVKDSNVYGYTNVYLEGDRVFGRTQEVNLGNITADANAWKARAALGLNDNSAVFSLKNGGGLRASLGSVLADGTKVGPLANAITGKPANAISQLDIENALRFDNKLMVCDFTPTGLLAVLNYAAGLSSGPTVQSGGYAQVGNIRFSYDSTQAAGAKVRTVVLINQAGQIVSRVVDNGAVRSDAPATITAVVLNFTMNGGDGYPIKANASNFRFLLTDGTVSAPLSSSLDFTAAANVPANALGEQKAFQDYLQAFHATAGNAYAQADTPVAQDTRIQQIAFRSDTVNAGAVFMPTFAFSTLPPSVNESAGKVTLTINRTSDLAAASVNISTANGTATGGTDYTALASVPVSFALNETSKTVDVIVAFRPGIQGSRTFTATLSGAETTSPATITVTITEADTFAASTGPNSGATPYVLPLDGNWQTKSILTVGDSVGGYQMAGIPDGLGAYDNGDGTLTLLMHHELGNAVGGTRAHGAIGAFISEWVINKTTLAVVSGSDLIQSVYNWNVGTQASNSTTSTVAFNRFCSADLPAPTAFYNAATGLGTTARIFMGGEEGGSNGWAVANVASGVDKGKSYILGKFNLTTNGSGLTGIGAWETLSANPVAQDKTIVIGNNDGGTGIMANSVAVYVGTKTNVGTEADKAGLTNGTLKFINVTGNPVEIVNTTTRATNITSGTAFTLSGTASTTFSRPEDGHWDPTNPSRFYFVTTDRLDQVQDGIGAQIGRTRLWRLNFTNIANPDLGGTIDLLLEGGVGNDANMWDNITVTSDGKLMLQEDVGGAAHNGKVWFYDPATSSLTKVLKHDPARFGDIVSGVTVAATAPYTNDEETSGVIDVSAIFGNNAAAGQRTYLLVDQAHYSTGISSANVEGGQLLLVRQTPKIAFSLAAATSTVTENAGNLVLTVNRFGDLQYGATVNVSTANGTAIAGTDYTALSNLAVNFAPGETTKTFNVAVTNRAGTQSDRTFTVSLTAAALGSPSTTTVTIIDTTTAAFTAWLAANGYNGGLGGDSDNDGIPDALEYFFNANPNSGADLDNLPQLVVNGSDLEFRFTYLTNTIFPGFLKCSEDLVNWVNATPGVDYEVITETVNGAETSVRYRIFCNPLPTTQGPFTYLTPFTAAVGRGAIDQLTITNHGMVGAGRLTGEALDSFGETMGASSGLSITGWSYNSGTGQFNGTFNVLPDRGYNSGSTFSNYAARVHQLPFTFTPYYGAGPVAQTQIVPSYSSTTKFTYLDGATTKFTTGLNAVAVNTIMGQSVGTAPAANGPGGATENLISFDAEAVHVFADGSGFVSDEYGAYIARFNSAKQFTRIIQLPAAAQPHRPVGTLNFDAVTAPTNGRRNNQGLEGLSVSPDNSRLFALLQSATIQDGAAAPTRYNTRLFVYDIAGANLENPVLVGEYAVQLPRYRINGNGAAADATAAQSEIVAISNTQFLMLPRDGNGLGKGTTDPIVTKTVDLVDFSAATNVLGLYDAEGNQISPGGTLGATITPARSTVVVNLLSGSDLTKFGFNTNTASPNQFTVNEKMEGMALVPDTSTASTEDYFLFVGNDNDFQSSNVRMIDATGTLVSYGDARDRGITNDAIFTAWRITITSNNRKFFRIQVNTTP